ncbi:unnamed protein product [Dibothriocephalus latus]|uniref:Sodium/calcium exchanger membrane region domain-containing protein n=1 Tax=Dibothriocephalus latus TaxID=60516 RepID=A0A3P7NXT4_DIBLA|nr:unnamed protein product [Dibothriocephalus latus]
MLAFGNGAPDVFSAITAITTGDPEAPDEGLGLGFLMGSGLLVNTITAGLIMIIRPFKTTRRPFIKDTLFYMSAVTWSAVILVRRMIYLSDSYFQQTRAIEWHTKRPSLYNFSKPVVNWLLTTQDEEPCC